MNTGQRQQPVAGRVPTLHVWAVRRQPIAPADLSAHEQERWRAYWHQHDRDRFATGVMALRGALGILSGVEVVIERRCSSCHRTDHGRPYAAAPYQDWSVSVSHAGDAVLVAVCAEAGYQVGVDVERVRQREVGVERLVLAGQERTTVLDQQAFTVLWTRKEAILKALGVGLAMPMSAIEVSPGSSPPRLIRAEEKPGLRPLHQESLSLHDIALPAEWVDYRAALAVLGAEEAHVRLRPESELSALVRGIRT